MKRIIMLTLLGLFAFGAVAGCRVEAEPDDDVDLKVDVD